MILLKKMSNLISFGEINRYIFLIFIGAVLELCLSFISRMSKFIHEGNIYIIIYPLGSIFAFILLIIYKIHNKRKNENKLQLIIIKKQKSTINKKEKFLWILLSSIIDFIAYVLSYLFRNGININLTTWSFDIIFLALFSNLILKEKLYKHHYLSIIIIMILNVLSNINTEKFSAENFKSNYINIIMIIISQILFELSYVLYKYYMIKKYIITYEIMFYEGIIELILYIITLIITTIYFKNIDNFWDYYNNLDTKEILIFISLTIVQFIYNLSGFIVIDKFSPFYVLLLYMTAELIKYIFYFDIDYLRESIISIIITIICLLMILIFVEIIQLNFFGLSYMTKKNIEIRSQIDSKLVINEEDNETKIDYQDYSIDLNETKLTE